MRTYWHNDRVAIDRPLGFFGDCNPILWRLQSKTQFEISLHRRRMRGRLGGVAVLAVLQDRICHVRNATVDALEVRQEIEMDGAGIQRLRHPCVEPAVVAIAQLLFVPVQVFLVP